MRYLLLLLTGCWLVLSACQHTHTSPQTTSSAPHLEFENFPVKSSIRAISSPDAQTLWYAGNRGQLGYTEDGGKTWFRDSISVDGKLLEFRSIVLTPQAVFLLSVSSPAIVFRSVDKGRNWERVYEERHPDTYYNSMKFWDEQEGIAVGDPVEGCLSVILTRDGGRSWSKLPCSFLPQTPEGEAGFAASNTNIDVHGDHVWWATGGEKSRILHSPDRGRNWEIFQTPIVEGGEMTGIYSMDFLDESYGIIVGGDWNEKSRNTRCKAMTTDGGKNWHLIRDGQEPGFRSCVQYVPSTQGKQLFAIGTPGISFSKDGGNSWMELSKADFYTIRINENSQTAWLAGRNKIARMRW